MNNLIPNVGVKLNIHRLAQNAYELELPFAIWRLPNSESHFFIVSKCSLPKYHKVDFEESYSGFIVSPFDNFDGEKSYIIEADLLIEFNLDVTEIIINNDDLLNQLNIRNTKVNLQNDNTSTLFSYLEDSIEKEAYLKKVSNATQSISESSLEKIVLSRKKLFGEIDTNKFYSIFLKLDKTYPSAFVSCIYLPWSKQIWLGATPEILVCKTQDTFQTMSLAGTQSAFDVNGNPIHVNHAMWTHKEIEEQALVSRYIINCFKKVRVREYLEEGPKTIKAGNLLHLQTKFTVKLEDINFPQFGTVMLSLLHPTSAVCGMPKKEALDFLLENENYNRELYSGYIGPLNIQNTSNLYVNLRTMKIQDNEFTLFAGGGITEDSVPDKEWRETELKFKTILNIL